LSTAVSNCFAPPPANDICHADEPLSAAAWVVATMLSNIKPLIMAAGGQ
jgi:hypothetical protein